MLAACGGSDQPSGTLTVSEIASATHDASTLRFSTETRFADGLTGTPYTGAVDEDQNASVVMMQPGTPGEFDLVLSGRRLYSRAVSPDVSLAYEWCEQRGVKWTKGYAGVRPFDTLSNLDAEGRPLREVGAERVRGTETVHYAIDGADPPVELWVDDQDRLRRLIWTHEGSDATDTVEIFDYGTPVEVVVPDDVPPCPKIPKGFDTDCVLGQTYDTLPPDCNSTAERLTP